MRRLFNAKGRHKTDRHSRQRCANKGKLRIRGSNRNVIDDIDAEQIAHCPLARFAYENSDSFQKPHPATALARFL